MSLSSEIIKNIKSVINFSDNSREINVHEPSFIGTNASKYIEDCLISGWVSSSGKWVTKFEELIKEFTGSEYVIAVSNGTVALRLALFIVGVRAGEEVIIPPLSFVATANAISHLGAFPHFVDIDSESLGMCSKALDNRLKKIAHFKGDLVFNKYTGRRIAGVVPVHVFGIPAKIDKIKNVCNKWKIPLVEDSAEALGSKVKISNNQIHCGCVGDIGTLSFNGNKIITTGGGGALLTNNAEFAKLAKHLSTTAKVHHPWEFYHDKIGWNDRLPNINAALGVSQLEQINYKIKKKRILHQKFVEIFQSFEDIEIIQELDTSISNYWLITMRLKGVKPEKIKESILQESHSSKIYLRPSWILLNQLPMYKDSQKGDLSESINQSKRLINLPSSPQLIND